MTSGEESPHLSLDGAISDAFCGWRLPRKKWDSASKVEI
jgi:hypothetical protein